VSPPVPSGLTYVQTGPPHALDLTLVDQRPPDGRTFSSGTIPAGVRVQGAPLDPPGFLAEHLSAELASRGLPARVSTGSGASEPRIDLRAFRIQNYRASGWTAFFASTFISADLVTGGVTKRIGVFVRRGKLPQWSFDEVNEPTMGVPLSLAVKDLASKVANQLYGYRAPDAKVQELVARLAGTHVENSFLDVYELGFTNNPLAIEPVASS